MDCCAYTIGTEYTLTENRFAIESRTIGHTVAYGPSSVTVRYAVSEADTCMNFLQGLSFPLAAGIFSDGDRNATMSQGRRKGFHPILFFFPSDSLSLSQTDGRWSAMRAPDYLVMVPAECISDA